MRIFKTSYRDRNGRKREASRWYVEFRDARETIRRLPAFTSKSASEETGRNLERLVAYHKGTGGQTDPALGDWLTGLPVRTRAKLVDIGLLSSERQSAGKPLSEHLADWRAALTAKGNTAIHVKLVKGRVQRVIDGIGARFYSDITLQRKVAVFGPAMALFDPVREVEGPEKPRFVRLCAVVISATRVATYLHGLRTDTEGKRGASPQTSNYYLRSLQHFCRWMVKNRRASENPVDHLTALNTQPDRRHDRRALTADELRALLAATGKAPTRFGMTGPERALLYRVAAESGLRAGELRSLTRASFDLDGKQPAVTVAAAYSKRRREDVQPLPESLADALRGFLRAMTPTVNVFRMPHPCSVVKMFRADLKTAGILYRDASGRVADFHCLRHTFITNLASGGVHPKTAQALARHSTITLTMDRYSHSMREDESRALAVLPDLGESTREALRATGTDDARADESVLAFCLAQSKELTGSPAGAAGLAQVPQLREI